MGKQLALLVVVIVVLAWIISMNLFSPKLTGYAVYSTTTTETNLVYGDNSTGLNIGSNATSYTWTYVRDGARHTINENSQARIIWNYDFNTTYNETQPAKINITFLCITIENEFFNISIYNYNTLSWDYLAQASSTHPICQNISAAISWSDANLTHYVNSSDGRMMLLLEDLDQSGTAATLRVDYLDINVTVSPLFDDWMSLTNATNNSIANGLNWTRTDSINVSTHWNASSVSVIDGALVLNDSNSGITGTFNASESSYIFGFSGNWTNYTLNFSNTSMFMVGGNYTVRIKSWDSFYQQNISAGMAWFGLQSYATVSEAGHNETNNSIVEGMPVELYCRVVDVNSSYQIKGYNVSFYNDTGYIGSNLTNSSGWAVYDYIPTAVNSTIICNITDQSGIFYFASGDNEQNLSLQIVNDTSPPIINSVRFRYRNATTNRTNLYANLSIIVNVTENLTDTTRVTAVHMITHYPDSTIVTTSLMQNSSSNDLWYTYFNATAADMPINMSGNYGVNITAYDLTGNVVWVDWINFANTNFTASNTFNVTLTDYAGNTTSYNRGEGLALYTLDVNGFVMSNVNWTVNITMYGRHKTSLPDANDATNRTYFILPNGSVGNWTIEVLNVTDSLYGVNTGTENFSFYVSSTLYPYFLYPLYQNRAYAISSTIADTGIKARINLSRNVTTDYNLSVNFTYPGQVSKILSREDSTTVYSNISGWSITVPDTYGTSFHLYLNASDSYNNTGSTTLTMRTVSQPVIIDDSGGGGSGSGVAGDAGANCTCEWQSIGCGPLFGECPAGTDYQVLVCDPPACRNDSRCFVTAVCSLVMAFNITAEETDFNLPSGENKTLKITLQNTGEANLTLDVNVEKSCCELSFMQRNISLTVGSSQDLLLKLHSSLLESPGSHNVTLNARIGSLKKSIAFNIIITRNRLFDDIEDLKVDLSGLEHRIAEFKTSGLWTGELEALAAQARQAIQEADRSIADDQLASAKQSKKAASADIDSVKDILASLEVQKALLDNKWWLLFAVILIVAVYYALFRIMLPLHRLSKEMKILSTREKEMVAKRKEIEVQYFQGKLNKATFQKMLVGEQGKILSVRAKTTEKVSERKHLIKKRLSPISILGWLSSGLVWVIRKIIDGVQRIKRKKQNQSKSNQ